MDPILKSLGYTQGTVGQRMQALARDPRYKFSEGDKGRAEIMAYIQERLAKIRAVLPHAFAVLVPGHLEVRRMAPQQAPGAPPAEPGARQPAVDSFAAIKGSNPLQVAREVDRYCAWPRQACGYKAGHDEINRLRDKAKAELGPKYDLRQFDDAVVMGGNVPMDV